MEGFCSDKEIRNPHLAPAIFFPLPPQLYLQPPQIHSSMNQKDPCLQSYQFLFQKQNTS